MAGAAAIERGDVLGEVLTGSHLIAATGAVPASAP
jgi:hypothetical protein